MVPDAARLSSQRIALPQHVPHYSHDSHTFERSFSCYRCCLRVWNGGSYSDRVGASRDGRYLFTVTSGKNEIWLLPLFGNRTPVPFLKTKFRESQPRLSPDGRWLAYRSDESKRNEIYVVSFPQPTAKWQISTEGGQSPVWSHDGRELYYYSPDHKVMAVEVKLSVPGGRPQFGVPRALFEAPVSTNALSTFEVSRDGRFLL